MNGVVNDIPGYVSVASAADELGVGEHRVRRLVSDGELSCARPSRRGMLIDASSLARYKLLAGAGRPWNAETAFAALWELSGLDAEWLDYAQRRRLDERLRTIDAESLVSRCRRRSLTRIFRVDASFLDIVIARTVVSGFGALERYGFDLTSSRHGVEDYVSSSVFEDVIRDSFAVDDQRGNVVLHVCDWMPSLSEKTMPEAVVAADLSASLDTRTRSAGIARLERLLDEYRSN